MKKQLILIGLLTVLSLVSMERNAELYDYILLWAGKGEIVAKAMADARKFQKPNVMIEALTGAKIVLDPHKNEVVLGDKNTKTVTFDFFIKVIDGTSNESTPLIRVMSEKESRKGSRCSIS